MKDEDFGIERRWLHLAQLDGEAFSFFYEKYHDPLYKFVLARVRDRDLTEDIVQDTFALAFDRLGRFQWRGYSLGAWLYRIALNLVRNHKRKAAWEIGYDPLLEGLLEDAGRGPLIDLVEVEDCRFLLECLESLKESDREIFDLFYWSELKVHEIAVIMDMPQGTVQSRLKRGREKIGAMFGERDAGLDEKSGTGR